jgi:pseudouridine synthase
MGEMRLQKMLARAGVASRRASEALIRQGRVQVNGQVVTAMGVQVDPGRDRVVVDGRPVKLSAERRYYKLYKPVGVLSVLVDDRGRPALAGLVPDAEGLHPAGRLDLDSEGLVLLTDDGEATYHLTHPRYEHNKEYLVLVEGAPAGPALRALRQGVELEDGRTAPAHIRPVQDTRWGPAEAGQTWLQMIIHEGRKRQIRRMCTAVGHPVQRLIRVRIGPILLNGLRPGEWRPLDTKEIAQLKSSVKER